MNAGTIIAQQIGKGCLFMIGAKDLVAGNDFLMMRIGRNQQGWNKVVIKLNGLDLYDITFYKIRKMDIVKQHTINNIYCDQLRDCIGNNTGMETKVPYFATVFPTNLNLKGE